MDNKIARSWILLVMLLAVARTPAQEQRITARQVVAEIQKHVGVEWKSETVDTFKAGNPDTAVTGIAVTMMATMDVLQRASAKGLNFVITHEPTFYAHLDTPEGLPDSDPVWAEKRAFIEKHGMVVWWFGGFTITGTSASPMELRREWCILWDGKNSRDPTTSICLFCLKQP